MRKLIELIQADNERKDILFAVSSVDLPDWYIGAGFVRNMVWDYLHDFSNTPLNDVDVIYFSKVAIDESSVLRKLSTSHPHVNWQIKNQACMHIRNGDQPYQNTIDAMQYWPEVETAIGVKLNSGREISFASPFDISSIFDGYITHNKKREQAVFLQRIQDKKWLQIWPQLRVRL